MKMKCQLEDHHLQRMLQLLKKWAAEAHHQNPPKHQHQSSRVNQLNNELLLHRAEVQEAEDCPVFS